MGEEGGTETPGEGLALSQAGRVDTVLRLHRAPCLFWYPFVPLCIWLRQTFTALCVLLDPSASPSLQTLPCQRSPRNLETGAPFSHRELSCHLWAVRHLWSVGRMALSASGSGVTPAHCLFLGLTWPIPSTGAGCS